MDPLLVGGLVLALLSMVVATLIDGNSFAPLIGPSSFLLVTLGSIGASIMAYRLADLRSLPKVVTIAFRAEPPDLDRAVTVLGDLADTARRQGMLALEPKLAEIEDPAIRSGVQLLVDGLDAEQVHERMQIDIAAVEERHSLGIGFFKTLGGYSPTFGMLGTVIGLINMLGNLSDPAQLGIGMALALLTTFYGVLFANLLWLPLSNRLSRLSELELAARDVILDGVLCIQSGTSPRLLVDRLETYLPPSQRIGYQERITAPTVVSPEQKAA